MRPNKDHQMAVSSFVDCSSNYKYSPHPKIPTTRIRQTMAVLLLSFVLLSGSFSPAAIASVTNSTDFIRQRCTVTLYPELCYTSLIPHEAAVQQNPLTLAVVAANVSLAKIKEASCRAAAMRRRSTGRIGSVLRDCVELLGTAADQTKQAAAEIRKLGSAGSAVPADGSGMAWRASNAQTWMSAAITNEDSCIDGFQDIDSGEPGAAFAIKAVCGKVGKVKQYSSNALALLNAFVRG